MGDFLPPKVHDESQVTTTGRFKSYRWGQSRIILRTRGYFDDVFIFGSSSCIIFAVVRTALLLLHFHAHSLCFLNQLVCPQYCEDFFHIRR